MTELVFILDRSGSMGGLESDTIGGFNSMIEKQKALEGHACVSTILASDFWCYPMFRNISESMGKPVPIGTLGLCIDPESRLLAGFTQEEYTTPAWYELLQHAHCEASAVHNPIIQMIDNTERCQRLNLLWEEDGVLHMTFRLWENKPWDATVRAFAASLVEAMA